MFAAFCHTGVGSLICTTMPLSFKVKLKEKVTDLEGGATELVYALKKKGEADIGVEAPFQKWIYKGRVLGDNVTLQETGIIDGDMVIAMRAQTASTFSATFAGEGVTDSTEALGPSPGATPPSSGVARTINVQQSPSTTNTYVFDMAMHALLANEEEKVKAAVGLLVKIANNIVANPMEDKFRKMKSTSTTFTSKLGALPGGTGVMAALGFTLVGEEWILIPSEQAWDNLVACHAKLQQFNTKLQGTMPSVSAATTATTATATATDTATATTAIANANMDQNQVLLMAMMAAMNSNSNSGSSGDAAGSSDTTGSSAGTGNGSEKA